MANEEIVRAACHVIWNEGDISRIGEFYAENYQANYPFGEGWGKGLEGARKFATEIRASFPDYREEIEDLVASGDRVVVRLRVQGTHTGPFAGMPATGKSFDIRDVTICRVENGKIVEQCGLSDNLSLYLQLGILEMPSLPDAAQ